MRFWSSLEVSPGAEERLNEIRKAVDTAINKGLAGLSLATEWSEWQWTFIVTVFAPDVILDYPERVRRSNRWCRQSLVSIAGVSQCAGINRHMVGDERALQERNSETILASSFALTIVR